MMDPQLKQQYLTDLYATPGSIAAADSGDVGDSLCKKDDNCIRLVSQNIGCLGIHSFGNGKQSKAIQWLIQNQVDIVAWQEIGIAFHMQQRCDRMRERMRDPRWQKVRVVSANNKHESIDNKQFGGTSVMAVDSVAARVTGTGCDETGLGRWSWMLFEGKKKWKTRIFSVYIPIYSKRMASVYQQHKRYYLQQNLDLCPRKQLLKEISKVIHQCQRNGEHVIVCTDANENLLKESGQVIQTFKVKCGLQEILRSLHPHISPPPTNQVGSKPIDSIFVSPALNNACRGGWLKFGTGIGDHRPLYIDINFRKLLGENRFIIKRPQVRRLKCEDPRIVSNFNKIFEGHGHKNHLFTKYKQLRGTFGVLPSSIAHSKLFHLDTLATAASRTAEKKCRKLKMGNVAYTAESAQMRVVIELWNNVIRKKSGANISSTYIKRLSKQCNITSPMDLSIDDCKTERSLMYRQLIDFAKTAKQSRKQFIDSLADAIAADGNEKRSTVVRRLIRNEEDRYARRNINAAVKEFAGATTRVCLDDASTGERFFTTDKDVIERALRNENEKKYTLAYSSPFLQEPLFSLLGQDSLTPTGDAILDGSFIPPDSLDEDTKRFISLLETHPAIKQEGSNLDTISLQQSLAYWNKKSEKISSSMSGRHIGTYKAVRKSLPSLEVVTGIMDLAYRNGVSLPRWQRTLDVSLLKKPGKFRPSELRTIGQLEADFNQGASLHFSRRMMNRALSLDLIPSSQYAKKGSQCIDAALVKILYLEHLRFLKMNGTFVMNDLMQCFDRMAHPVSALCTRRLGVPPLVVRSMITSLTKMKHFLRTAYGDSDIFYGNNQRQPLQGAIQGNGAAAQIFVAISCIMIKFLETQCDGFTILTSISLTALTFIVVMYVDDADIMVSARDCNESILSLISRTQTAIDTWRKGAEQTGAALRPNKCKWFLVAFKWKDNRAAFHNSTTAPGQLYQQDTDGNTHLVERLEVHHSAKGLGVLFNPIGCWKAQFEETKAKVHVWCNNIRTSSLNSHEVYMATNTGVLRTISYVLPVTSFNKKQCTAIDAELYSTILPRMNMNRHLPLVYRYGPKKCHGLGLSQTVIKQYIEKVKKLLQHANQPTQLGISIISILETIHLTMGVSTPLFQLEYSKFQFLLEPCWIKDIWRISSKYNIQIYGQYARPQPQRRNDFAIMERIVLSGRFKQAELLKINRLRIYLQVLFMSDITTIQGTRLKTNMFDVKKNKYSGVSKWKWPYQELTSRIGLSLWRRALVEICTGNGTQTLSQPLTTWIRDPHILPAWLLSPCHTKLYRIHSSTSYIEYHNINANTRYNAVYSAQFHCDAVSDECVHAEVEAITDTRFQILGTITPQIPPAHINQFSQNKFLTSTPSLHSLLRFSIFPDDGQSVAFAIQNGSAVAVTDASIFSDQIGAAAWVIQCTLSGKRCEGRVRVLPGSSKMNSYRAEVFGIYTILIAVQQLCQNYQLQNGKLIVACDNDDGLMHSLIFERRIPVRFKTFDLLWAIHSLLQQLPILIVPTKVTGHTDRLGRAKTLLERLNIEMDQKAKSFCRYAYAKNVPPPSLANDPNWGMIIDDQHITENLDLAIAEHIHGQSLFHHLKEKQQITEEGIQLVNWNMLGQVHNSLPRSRYIWVVKFASGFLPTANHMFRHGNWEDNLCPLCKSTVETNAHLMRCSCDDAILERHSKIYDLHQWLLDNNTDPNLAQVIIYTLINGPNTSFSSMVPSTASPLIKQTAIEQDILGWDNFLLGRMTSTWAQAQQQYFDCVSSNTNAHHGLGWMKRLIARVYDMTHAVWLYRNSVVHAEVEANMNQKTIDKLNNEIDRLYALGKYHVCHSHRYLFDEGVSITKERSAKQKKYWVRTVQVSSEYHKQAEDNMYVGMRTLMRQWAMQPD